MLFWQKKWNATPDISSVPKISLQLTNIICSSEFFLHLFPQTEFVPAYFLFSPDGL